MIYYSAQLKHVTKKLMLVTTVDLLNFNKTTYFSPRQLLYRRKSLLKYCLSFRYSKTLTTYKICILEQVINLQNVTHQ